jgi:predicted  nucleic acid-binding Zn-ribbon protein
MSRASNLFHVQEIDTTLDAARTRLAAIEQALSGNAAVNAAQQQTLQASERFNAARIQARSLELEVQALNEKVADAEKRLYSGAITNPKELRDLEQDLASLRRRRAGVEERELEAMIGAETRLQQTERETLQTQGTLVEERSRLQARVAQLAAEREAVSGSMPAEDQLLYQRLRQSKNHRPVAKLDEGNCAACGEETSSARIQEARRGATLVRCTGCERILYAE